MSGNFQWSSWGGLAIAAWLVLAVAMDAEQEGVVLALAIKRFGHEADGRLKPWFSLMHSATKLNEMEKLQLVNNFFNRIPNVSDATHWNDPDYWASPMELLASNGGDCEDFALAKYFTLRELGVPDERLRLTYAKAFLRNAGQIQSHMVLTYYSTLGSEPWVLDNLTDVIQPASHRSDLTPSYSFRVAQLWIAHERQSGQINSNADLLTGWRELRASMLRMDALK